jgi:hypothetical protein
MIATPFLASSSWAFAQPLPLLSAPSVAPASGLHGRRPAVLKFPAASETLMSRRRIQHQPLYSLRASASSEADDGDGKGPVKLRGNKTMLGPKSFARPERRQPLEA